jgi:tRNA A-37 threonylcarbamoyl transferase component Bud32
MSNTVKLPTCPKCGAPIPMDAPQGLCPKCVLLGAATGTEQGVPATATSEIPSIERIAAAFPQLEILELIGRGGMGFVFKARQPHLDRYVALKLLPDKLAKDPQFAERFNREGRVLAKLNHPNIVSVFDFGQTGGFYYLTMEYVDGVNLRQAMRAGRFSPAEALSIVPKVCEALQYAHEQGILHRDIKPENILLDAKGRVKIADFGIAKLVGEDQPNITLTNTGAALGTPHYMAPEQLEKPATVDHRADIYSLGVVFYEMLTGELPIGRFAAPSSKTPVNTTVDDVVFRTLEKDRERRFQSAGEMKTQVEHLGAGSFEQPEAEEDDEAPRSWLEALYSMRLVGWFLAAFCLVNFLLPHFTRLGNSPEDTFMVGLSRPWLVNVPLTDAQGVVTREWRWVPSASSFASGVFGLVLLGALLLWRTRLKASEPADAAIAPATSTSLWHRVAPALLSVLLLFSLIAVLSFERREFEMHGQHRSSFRLGWPDPWVAIGELRADGSLGSSVNLATSSMLFGAIAVVCAVILLRLSRTSLEPRLRISHRFSHWSIYGALSVGLSLPVPFAAIVGLLTGMGGIGPAELWLALGSVALPGLGGTLLGWLSLNEIRESRGRVKGLPLAMFATLFWPLTVLGGVTIGVPMVLLVPGGEPTAASTIGRFLVLLLPAAVIAFGFWTIHATARWASQQKAAQQRGILKWVFIVVLVVGMGVVMVTNPGRPDGERPAPQMFVSGTPVEQTSDSPASLRANFRFAKGHVVTFQVMRRVGEDHYEPVPHFGGYAVAPDDERGRFSIMLSPDRSGSTKNPLVWHIRLESEGGGSAGGPSASLGELISMLPTNHFHEMEADASFGLYLTRAYPGAETNGIVPLAELSLDVRSMPRGKVGVAPENTLLRLGSTNWAPALKQLAKAKPAPRAQPGEVLASQWLKSPVGTNTTNWIQFTFTNVELRKEDGQQWLAMGFVTDRHGDCEEVFRVDANGFKPVTRKTSWRTTPTGGSPVEYSGIQWLVPPGIEAATLESFRDSVAEALVGKSFIIPEGEQRPLIRFPIGKVGDLSVGIGAKLKLRLPNNSASVPEDTAAEARVRMAREQLDAARQLFESGRIGRKEFLEAEHRLSGAEARGDAVAIARANLTFANAALAIGKQHFEAGVISAPEYKILQNQQAVAELELKEAQRTKEASAK